MTAGPKRTLLIIAALALLLGAAWGVTLLRDDGPTPPGQGLRGKWHQVRGEADEDAELSPAQQRQAARLESLSYLSGYNEAPAQSGVTVHREGAASPGANLVISGHGPEITLIDMAGKPLHRWRLTYDQARARFPTLRRPMHEPGPFTFRRARLLPDGTLLAIYEGFGLVKMDRDSEPLWVYPGAAHHDLAITAGGQVVVLSRRARIVKRLHPTQPCLVDYICWLTAKGKLVRQLSLLEAFERSDFAHLLEGMARSGDIFHTNTVKVLDGRHADKSPAFRKGNLLLSMLYLDTVAIVDPDRGKVIWARKGGWHRQHEPVLLQNGNLLVFDNNKGRGHSRVLELDPLTWARRWAYQGGKDGPFYSAECGVAQRLPNGNTLITESLNGRAFEVTPAKEIVWEYYNPHRAGKDDRLIATLFDVLRLDPDFPLHWTQAQGQQTTPP